MAAPKKTLPDVPKADQERYDSLKTAIEHYRHQFHVYDVEEITEEARDSLMHELTDLEGRFPTLVTPDSPSQRIGGTQLPQFEKVRHSVPQWSFNDAFTPEDIRDFDTRVKRFPQRLISGSESQLCVRAQDRRTQDRLFVREGDAGNCRYAR